MNCSRRPAKQVCETAGCRVTLLRCGLMPLERAAPFCQPAAGQGEPHRRQPRAAPSARTA
jgi:hypothetical protein